MRILDTDTCIALLRGASSVIARREALSDQEVATTWITAAELYFGAAKSRAPEDNRAVVSAFLRSVTVVGLDAAAAQIFGEAKALLERRGERLPDADLFIGAIAASRSATVVTGNGRHYRRIPGVAVEDWIRG